MDAYQALCTIANEASAIVRTKTGNAADKVSPAYVAREAVFEFIAKTTANSVAIKALGANATKSRGLRALPTRRPTK